MKATIEYEITDIDYFENDAILVVGENRYYFQWDAKDHPTIIDALDFFKKEQIILSEHVMKGCRVVESTIHD